MPDLTKEYFERDLTEAEEESLAREIASSPNAALRLAESARRAYEATGLPLPSPPKSPGALFDGPSFGAAALLVALGMLLATGAYVVWHCGGAPPEVETAAPRIPAVLPVVSAIPHTKRSIPRSVSPFVTPQAAAESDPYEALDVLVRRASAGSVTIRVLDASGKVVRNLYAGRVAEGLWRFPWNGHLDGGPQAEAGDYTIEVGTSSGLQRRTVRLKSEAPTPGSK